VKLIYSTTAEEITKRLAESVVRAQYSRADLCCFKDAPTEQEMVDDAIMVSLGDDPGCLGDDEMTAEYIDVLFVEQKLKSYIDAQMAVAKEILDSESQLLTNEQTTEREVVSKLEDAVRDARVKALTECAAFTCALCDGRNDFVNKKPEFDHARGYFHRYTDTGEYRPALGRPRRFPISNLVMFSIPSGPAASIEPPGSIYR